MASPNNNGGSEACAMHDWDLPPPVVPIYSTPVGGRLQIFWPNWTILEDQFVTEILRQGYTLPIINTPPLTNMPRSCEYAKHQIRHLQENIEILLQKKAIEVVADPDHNPGLYSPIFVIRKKDSGKMRMIHNLALFNERYLSAPPHFRMTTLDHLRSEIMPQDWLVSLDIQDAYLHVPIRRAHRKYLRFFFEGSHYQWAVLPFGISTAPWLFTRITASITRFLHLRKIRFDPYRDCQLLAKQKNFTIKLLQHGEICKGFSICISGETT